ncbi:MAG: cephalosporin hydroxylase family protein [Rhizobiaceae bacterium]|nr:cephalosporin hydroxylase family protein [Rhizobiaceae bacterium]
MADRIVENSQNEALVKSASQFVEAATAPKYCYNFSFLGRPIIQYPQDMVAVQELIYATQPDLIVETGIAHGGSLIMSAAMLELNAACGGNPDAHVVGIDIDIREHNRVEIEKHPMFKRITMFEGSSIDPQIVDQVKKIAEGKERVLVFLDSMHSHDHVLAELEAYANLTTVESYCVVFDTIIEDLPDDIYPGRPWGVGDNAKTAVHEWLKSNDHFEIDKQTENKLLITVCPDGFLKRVR